MKAGYSTYARFIRALDGDTYEFEVVRRFKVRLLGIDTPEMNTEEGKNYKKIAREILEKAQEVVIFIPSGTNLELVDINSFNRLLGEVYVDGKSMKDLLMPLGSGATNVS